MNYENLPVYKATFDLLLMVYRRTPRMQRDYRYTLGEEAKRALQEVISCIYQANLRDEGKLRGRGTIWCVSRCCSASWRACASFRTRTGG